MRNKIILVGDNHNDGGAVTLLAKALPELYKLGYETLFCELTHADDNLNDPKELINEYGLYLDLLELFPQGKIPDSLNAAQTNVVNEYRDHNNYSGLVTTLELNKARKVWLKAYITLFQKVIELGIKLVAIDVQEPSQYERPSGMEERNKFMFKKIEESKKNGIVLTGLCHIINVWELERYNRGLLYYFLKCTSYEISGIYFPYFNENAEDTNRAFERLAACSQEIIDWVRKIHIEDSSDLDSIINWIIKGESRVHNIKLSEDLVTYYIPKIEEKTEENKHTLYYLTDLGAKIIKQNANFFICQMPSSSLSKARRILLGLDRRKIPCLNQLGVEQLQKQVHGITIEENMSERKMLITFPMKKINLQYIEIIINNSRFLLSTNPSKNGQSSSAGSATFFSLVPQGREKNPQDAELSDISKAPEP